MREFEAEVRVGPMREDCFEDRAPMLLCSNNHKPNDSTVKSTIAVIAINRHSSCWEPVSFSLQYVLCVCVRACACVCVCPVCPCACLLEFHDVVASDLVVVVSVLVVAVLAVSWCCCTLKPCLAGIASDVTAVLLIIISTFFFNLHSTLPLECSNPRQP